MTEPTDKQDTGDEQAETPEQKEVSAALQKLATDGAEAPKAPEAPVAERGDEKEFDYQIEMAKIKDRFEQRAKKCAAVITELFGRGEAGKYSQTFLEQLKFAQDKEKNAKGDKPQFTKPEELAWMLRNKEIEISEELRKAKEEINQQKQELDKQRIGEI